MEPADELVGVARERRPESVPLVAREFAEPPVEHFDNLGAIHGQAAVDVTLHQWVAVKFDQQVEIVGREPTQDHPRRLEIHIVTHSATVVSQGRAIVVPHCDNPVEVCPESNQIPVVGIDLTAPTVLATAFLLSGSALVRLSRRRVPAN